MNKKVIFTAILLSLVMASAVAQTAGVRVPGSHKGWSVGVGGSYGMSPATNHVLTAMSLDYDDYSWETIPGNCFTTGVNGYYFFNKNFGIRMGIFYNTYQNNFLLNGIFRESELSIDLNGSEYYKIREANYDSDIDLSYISLPLIGNFILGKPGKNGLFVEAGMVYEQKVSALYKTTGTYEFYGYYPDHPAVTQIINIVELGFSPQVEIDGEGDIQTNSINISGYISFGLNLAFGYLSTVRIGPEFLYGVRDINMGLDYEKIFGNTAYQETILKKYSIKVSYILKL